MADLEIKQENSSGMCLLHNEDSKASKRVFKAIIGLIGNNSKILNSLQSKETISRFQYESL